MLIYCRHMVEILNKISMSYYNLKKRISLVLTLAALATMIYSCNPKVKEEKATLPEKGSFAFDVDFLSKHQERQYYLEMAMRNW